MFLASFPPLSPDPGQFLWTTIIFLVVWLVLGRTAFKPIANGLKKREDDIQDALDAAKQAKAEMEELQSKNDELLREAREERSAMLKEAKEAADGIVKEAKEKAKVEANQLVDNARAEIEAQKSSAMREVKKEVGALALNVAEQVMRKQLADEKEQKELISRLVEQMGKN
jgi:F-type H+-transporting ATPase subunit b